MSTTLFCDQDVVVGSPIADAPEIDLFGALASELPTPGRGRDAAWNRAVTRKNLADRVGHSLASEAAGSGSRGRAAGRTFSVPMPSDVEKSKPAGSDAAAKSPIFATTHWTMVLAAGDRNHPGATGALDRLCRTYWYPVYACLRRKGRIAAEVEEIRQLITAASS